MEEKMKNIVFLMIGLLLLSACQTTTTPQGKGTFEEFSFGEDIETKTFKSESELNDFIQRNQGSFGGFGPRALAVDAEFGDVAIAESAPAKSLDFSETNVQVEGIDEADIIKTDGNYIYTITRDTLFIIKAYPGEVAEIVSEVKFDNNPSGLFIDEDRLSVFGNQYNNLPEDLPLNVQASF